MYTASSPNVPEYHIFNPGNGLWEDFDPPAQSLYDDFSGMIQELSDEAHLLLDIAAVHPIVGLPFDIIQAVFYLLEGNTQEAGIAIAGVLFFTDIVIKPGKYAIFADELGEVTKVARRINEQLTKELLPLGFVVDEALLRNVKMPDTIQKAIQGL